MLFHVLPTPGVTLANDGKMQIALYNVHAGAQAAYGAVIVTFVGAVHWGLAMADYRGLQNFRDWN